MSEILERVQVLLEPEQRRSLAEIAKLQGKSVADVTRFVIRLGLQVLKHEDEFTRRQTALVRAKKLRDSMPVLDLDIVENVNQMRRERDDQLSGSSD